MRARELALDFPETVEQSHFGKADFRVRNRIFVSLPEPTALSSSSTATSKR